MVLPMKVNVQNISTKLNQIEKEQKIDKETIHSLNVENEKLIVVVKHLTESIEKLSDKFDSFIEVHR